MQPGSRRKAFWAAASPLAASSGTLGKCSPSDGASSDGFTASGVSKSARTHWEEGSAWPASRGVPLARHHWLLLRVEPPGLPGPSEERRGEKASCRCESARF